MCLAVPAKIEEIANGVARCRVGEGETFISASLMLLDQTVEPVEPSDYIIIHAGFALRKLDLLEARQSLDILRELATAREQSGLYS